MSSSKEVKRRYYEKNKERLLLEQKERYKNNKDKLLKYQKEYRDVNRLLVNTRVKTKRLDRLTKAIDILGGKCNRCLDVFDPVCYDFHHINPKEKEFTIGENMLVGEERFYTEVSKCILLCANCHRLIHKELRE